MRASTKEKEPGFRSAGDMNNGPPRAYGVDPSKERRSGEGADLPTRRGARHTIVAACFLATFIAYVERTGFSVAYTAAAKEQAVSEAVKGTVLSSFFWGYALSQVSLAVKGCCQG